MWNVPLQRLDHSQVPSFVEKNYGADQDSTKLIINGINVVFRFEKEGKGHYLKVTHSDLRSLKELQNALHFQQFLFEKAQPVPEIITSHNGQVVENLTQGQDTFLCHVTKEVPGEIIAVHDKIGALDADLLKNWGRTLAQFHQISQSYATPDAFKNGEAFFEEFDAYVAREDVKIQAEYQNVKSQILSLSIAPDNFGLTHGDHRPGNVLNYKGRVSLLDFDAPVRSWFMADIARPFFDLYIERDPRLFEKAQPFFEGYRQIFPDALIDPEIFLLFLRLKALDIYLWTINNFKNSANPSGGSVENWMKEIRKSIEKVGRS